VYIHWHRHQISMKWTIRSSDWAWTELSWLFRAMSRSRAFDDTRSSGSGGGDLGVVGPLSIEVLSFIIKTDPSWVWDTNYFAPPKKRKQVKRREMSLSLLGNVLFNRMYIGWLVLVTFCWDKIEFFCGRAIKY
jgi:hypothetical protein